MNQLTSILLHMDLMDTDLLRTCRSLDLHISIAADRIVQLRDLIVLWVIRIKIVFTIKFTILSNGTVRSKSYGSCILNDLLIQHWQRTRHTGTHRAGMGVGCSSKFCTAGAEDLGLSCKFYMNLQTDDGLILFAHLRFSSLILLFCCFTTLIGSGLLISISSTDDVVLFEAVADQLHTDRQSGLNSNGFH